MKVCYFGTYEGDYPRNRVMIKNLRKSGVEVMECHVPLWERQSDKSGSYLAPLSLIRVFCQLLFSYLLLVGRFFRMGNFDYMMIGYIGQLDVFLARCLLFFRRRPLVFNPLISLYDTLVVDRGIFGEGTFTARILYRMDRWSFQLADLIVLDTNAHIEYLSRLLKVDKKKFVRIFVGADEDIFYPREQVNHKDGRFRVLFYGKFIPLHGIHHILNAAKELENDQSIQFRVIGHGQLSEAIHTLAERLDLRNVDFIDWVPYEMLPREIAEADLCLGIFGHTEKAQRVIPNKVFQALACGKPVITSDTVAIHELESVEGLCLCSFPIENNLASLITNMRENHPQRGSCSEDLNKICIEAFDNFVSTTFQRIGY
jgi:glycosyltransferase involved in cell wall biosynthesis